MRNLLCVLVLVFLSNPAHSSEFVLSSSKLSPGGPIPMSAVFNGFGCTGENRSPPLRWSGVPAGTKSLALTVYDPDAPTGSGWWHWIVFNLPTSLTELSEDSGRSDGGSLPVGTIQSRTDFGTPGYGGPCPPPGSAHRYIFTLWALRTDKLPLDNNASGAMVGFFLNAQAIAKTSLTASYRRE